MKAAMERENILAAVLAVAAVLLAGILVLEWARGSQLQQELTKMRAIPVTPLPPLKVMAEFNLPNAETGFPELLSRPMFAASRRASASAGKGGGAMKKGQFVLVGVLITPQQRSALLRDVQTNKTETVALVGVVRGMTLGEVESTRVVLRQGAESEELLLMVQSGPKSPAPPAPPQNRVMSASQAASMQPPGVASGPPPGPPPSMQSSSVPVTAVNSPASAPKVPGPPPPAEAKKP